MTITASPIEADDVSSVPLLVSVDDHIVEPPALWADRLPASRREDGPHVVRERVVAARGPDRGQEVWCDVWHYEDVTVPMERGFAAAGYTPEETDMVPVTFDEMRPGCYDRDARLADMDIDGVEASVCFPNNFARFCGQRFLEAKDRDLALLCVQAYNDWAIEEWSQPSDGRLVASGLIPLWDAELAAAEVRRNAARGCPAVCFSEIPARLGLPSMYSGYWEPFFAACAETGTVINHHIGSSSLVHTTSEDAPLGVRVSNHYGNSSFSLTDWLLCGAFIRHPSLKVAFSEGQAGWIPYLMSRLDGLWRDGNASAGVTELLPDPPSSYLHDHVFACIFDDPSALRHLDLLGEDNLCFETDYPHPDGFWPHSRDAAWAQTRSLDPELRLKILRTNGARLYGLDRVLTSTP